MTITDIKEQTNDASRLSVFIDGKFAFGISKVDSIIYKLKIGMELSPQEYNKIINQNMLAKARDKALKLLSLRARSQKEIEDKLKGDYPQDIIDNVMELLKKYDYINDEMFAQSYAKDKFKHKGWSRKRIAFELKIKGISDQIITDVFEQNDFDPSSAIEKLLTKRLKGKTSIDYKERQKQFNYLASKGYEFDDIKNAINKLAICTKDE